MWDYICCNTVHLAFLGLSINDIYDIHKTTIAALFVVQC